MSRRVSVILISFLIFWLIFAPKAAIIPDSTISGWITNAICLFLIWYVRCDLKNLFVGENRAFNLILLIYCGISVYSVYYNADTIDQYELISLVKEAEEPPKAVTSIRHVLYLSIGLLASSLYIQRISNTKYIRTLLRTLFFLVLMVLIPTYIEVLTKPVETEPLTEYCVGNKFSIGYYHLYLCTLYYLLHPYLNRKEHKLKLLFFIFLMLITSVITQCSTMIMGAFIFMSLSFFASDSFRNVLASAKNITISVIVINIGFFFLATWLIQYDFVQYIIDDVLNEDFTLTGRLQIYADIQEAFTESPWIGLGYGNSIVVSYFFTDAYDSQNGLIELFIQIGLIGVVAFLILLYTASRYLNNNDLLKYPFVVFIYTIIGIATVEIPYKFVFIFFLSFCFIKSDGYPKALLKQTEDCKKHNYTDKH